MGVENSILDRLRFGERPFSTVTACVPELRVLANRLQKGLLHACAFT